ncbi:hypothetical protein TSA66_18690 [Noviherbaspirillum autotrophicum]|uniref:Lipoprotein n=2 Tax=Noviherbaspirillum autotrophicum TaxID=709839 RepID=A0A0C1YT53_9BURK|nr:hypothetical protein TSA66_18690 [Noviherbaspirillum autotrophicum]
MTRQIHFLALAASALIAGCSLLPAGSGNAARTEQAVASDTEQERHANAVTAAAYRMIVEDNAGRVEVEKVEFRSGVSSTTVERLARQHDCAGSAGAGLLTVKGPVEVYRMQCDNGKVFMARCELRQCRPMH